MTEGTRQELVNAAKEAYAIVADAFPFSAENLTVESYSETMDLRKAALPEILREILDFEVEL